MWPRVYALRGRGIGRPDWVTRLRGDMGRSAGWRAVRPCGSARLAEPVLVRPIAVLVEDANRVPGGAPCFGVGYGMAL